MAGSISPERMQRLMELSNNAMTVELGALRNPQVTTVPSNSDNAFYQSAPYAEREVNKYLYEQYRNIEKAQEKFADGDLSKYRFEEAISDAEFEINRLKNFYENGLDQMGLDYLDQKQQEGISSLKNTVSTEFNPDFSMPELDQSRDQIVLGEKMSESVLAHEMGHAAFSEAKDFFRSKVVELGSIEDALKATALEYGENIANKIYAGVRGNLDGFFADTDEATVQYYDNPLGDDPSNPGGGTPTSEGGPTYYSPGGGFDADTDNTFSFLPLDRANATDPLLQKPFTDYRTGELVYHDEYKGDFEADLKKAGLMGFETLMSDLISERKGLDRFAERQRRGLKINPLGAPPSVAHETIRDEYGKILFNKGAETGGTQVLRSVRPQLRPEKYAQGGPVMRGIGTLNETARNMTRGPRGIGAYQQFASGGEAMGPPPTRGPDPQGIGYFQKFADGGPVYMKEGGEVITPDDIAGMRDKIMKDYGFDPEDVAVQEGVPPELFLRLLFKENRGRQGPKSPKGAIGLAQLMPATAEELGVDPTVPYENAVGGARYLKQKIAEFDGDVLLGLAAYNAGAGNVRKYEGVPPFAETQDYVAVILGEGYSGGTSISETIRKEQGFAPSMSYEGQENDVREEQGLVPISVASSGTAEGVGSLMRQESSAPETSLRPVLRPTAPSTSLRPVLRPEESSSAPETSLRPVLRGQDQTLREKYAPENFERNLLSPDAFQYFNGLGVMEREGKKQGIETLDPRGIRRINNFAMERSTMA